MGVPLGSYEGDPVYDRKNRNLYTLFMTLITWGRVRNQGTAYQLDERQYPEYDKKLRKFGNWVETDTLFMTRNSKNHTLFSGSPLYSPYMGVPAPRANEELNLNIWCIVKGTHECMFETAVGEVFDAWPKFGECWRAFKVVHGLIQTK